MKLTRIMKAAAAGALMLALSTPAQAAWVAGWPDYEINIYGASAQFTFWNGMAPDFLTNVYGCTATAQAAIGTTHGVTQGTGCTGLLDRNGDGQKMIVIRYSSKASYDGIYAQVGSQGEALSGTQIPPAGPTANAYDSTVPPGPHALTGHFANPQNYPLCPDNHHRLMADEQTISGTTINDLKCAEVTLGASDVAGESFTQISHGLLKGPCGGADVGSSREFPPTGIDASSLKPYNPIVVPFGFFVNNSVTMTKCSGGARKGEMCTTATEIVDCGGTGLCGAPATIDNISRMMAVQIFGNQSYYWRDFGDAFVNRPIVACLRHAGSGTHATLDYAVIKGSGWGGTLIQDEADNRASNDYSAFFNDSTGDMLNCVNGGGTGFSGFQDAGAWTAIGYADADAMEGKTGTYPNITNLKYNGSLGTRANIRNGFYDFWANQFLYERKDAYTDKAAIGPIVIALDAYASDPAHLGGSLGTKALYWATQNEMNYQKANDASYPVHTGAAIKQSP